MLLHVSFGQSSGGRFSEYYGKAQEAVHLHKYIEAEGLLDTAMWLAKASGNLEQQAFIELELGNSKKYLGDYASALDHYHNALEAFEYFKNWEYLCKTNLQLGEYYRKLGNYELARQYLNMAFSIYETHEVHNKSLLIRIYSRYAAIANESSNEFDQVISLSRTAIAMAKEIADSNSIATSMNEIGYTYKNLLWLDSSEYYYKQAERIWFSIGNYYDAVHAMNNRAMLYAHNNYPKDLVIQTYEQLIDTVEKYNLDYPMIDVYVYMHYQYLWEKDTGKAFIYFRKFHEATHRNTQKVHDINIYNLTEKYESEKIRNEYQKVSNKLDASTRDLEEKNRETTNLILFVILLGALLIVILVLTYKLRSSNSELKLKNKEKDTLIQEIHHRVKNNLQFISSLISMQMKASSDDVHSKTLMDASRRISAMALVHEMLYNQSENSGISIKLYLEELIASLKDMVNSDSRNIRFVLDIEDYNFSVSDAISLGMITSEVISNSIKHAFKQTPEPNVTIQLKGLGNKLVYVISDNGSGFDGHKKDQSSLGLRLVDIFSRQLKGDYTIKGSSGFEYQIEFNRK